MKHVLAVRTDGMGDVLLAGPAIRAIAQHARVTLLCGPGGAPVASKLPGVSWILEHRLPWIDADPDAVDANDVDALVRAVRSAHVDEAVIFTSFHQSPLPTALLLRLAGVRRIGAISIDYPGSLLDVRHTVADDLHEVIRNLSLADAMGYRLPATDDRRLRLCAPESRGARSVPYVVVHPGASVPARTLSIDAWASVIDALVAAGHRIAVTGSRREGERWAGLLGLAHDEMVIPSFGDDIDELIAIIAAASAIVVGNTGPAHLAAAVGTPVVSCFPPTVPANRWHPWGVPTMLLGDQQVTCAGCRARVCPHERQHCLAGIRPQDVTDAVEALLEAVSPHERCDVEIRA